MRPIESGLCTVRKQYFSLYPPHLIDLDFEPRLSLARHQPWIVQHLVSGSSFSSYSHAGLVLASKYPPADDYQRKFWKLLISALEAELRDDEAVAEELELDDRIAEHYSQLVIQATCPTNVPGPSYKTYIYESPPTTSTHLPDTDEPSNPSTTTNNNVRTNGNVREDDDWIDQSKEKEITLLEAQTTIEAGSTGLRTWTASLYLATKFLQISTSTLIAHPSPAPFASPTTHPSTHPPHPEPPQPTRPAKLPDHTHFLELGSGTGFLACFLAQTGKNRTIWATDVGDPEERDDVQEESHRSSSDDDGEDVDPAIIAREVLKKGPIWGLRGNVEINRAQFQPGSQVIPLSLDWYDAIPPIQPDDQTQTEAYEKMVDFSRGLPADLVILATDVIYDPDLVIPLCATLRLFLTQTPESRSTSPDTCSSGRFVLLAATIRNQETTDKFYVECDRIGLNVEHVTLTPPNEPESTPSTGVSVTDTDPIFWNASVWEGGDVRMIKIWV